MLYVSCRENIQLVCIPQVGKTVSAIQLVQAITGKDSKDSRRLLKDALNSAVESTRKRAEAVLFRLYYVPGFIKPTWVLTYNESLQMVCDVIPDKYTVHIKSRIYWVFQRVDAGDQSLHQVINANGRSTGVRAEFARDGLGLSQAECAPVVVADSAAMQVAAASPVQAVQVAADDAALQVTSVAAVPVREHEPALKTWDSLREGVELANSLLTIEKQSPFIVHTILEISRRVYGLPAIELQPPVVAATAVMAPTATSGGNGILSVGTLYAAISARANMCKIGITRFADAQARVEDFRTSCPDYEQVCVVHCAFPRNIEKRLQFVLRARRIGTETFRLTDAEAKLVFADVHAFVGTELGQRGIYETFDVGQQVRDALQL